MQSGVSTLLEKDGRYMGLKGTRRAQAEIFTAVNTYCHRCDKEQLHDIYRSPANYLHSSCRECGKDVPSDAEVAEVAAGITRLCLKEGAPRHHIRYISKGGYTHFFCCTCGKDVSGGATIEKMQREVAKPPAKSPAKPPAKSPAERPEEEIKDAQRDS
jgi:hypothetical protein